MFALAKTIVTLYEDNHLDPEDIAKELGGEIDVLSVKATLAQYSSLYKKDTKQAPSTAFTLEEQFEAKEIILSVMREMRDDDPNLAARMAKYVRNDSMGRLDVMKDLAKLQLNTIEFNERLNRARMANAKTFNQLTDEQQKPLGPAPTNDMVEVEVISNK